MRTDYHEADVDLDGHGSRPRSRPSCLFALVVLAIATLVQSARAQATDEELEPGLVATYRAKEAVTARVEPRPAFYLGPEQSPHPELPPSNWTGHWTGRIRILRGGKYRFAAHLRGRVRVKIDDQEVLSGSSTDDGNVITGPQVRLSSGDLPVLVYYEAPGGGVARLQLFWQSDYFPQEPIPGKVFWHDRSTEEPLLRRWQPIERGRALAELYNCAACHTGRPLSAGLQPAPAPDLSDAGGRLKAGWIYRWVLDPTELLPEAYMPAVLGEGDHADVAARAVALFLAGRGAIAEDEKWKSDPQLAHQGETVYRTVGCAACHDAYSDREPLRNLDGVPRKYRPAGLTAFLRDPRRPHPGGRMPSLLLKESEAEALTQFLFRDAGDMSDYTAPEPPTVEQLVAVARAYGADPGTITRIETSKPPDAARLAGRLVLTSAGCLGCHTMTEDGRRLENRLDPIPLRTDDVALTRGCLADTDRARRTAPRFALRSEDREALRAFLQRPVPIEHTVSAPVHELPRLIERLGCVRCHRWQGKGGLPVELVNDLRERFGADHAEQVSAPALTGVGEKLRPDWMRRVLTEGARARPWMPLRMPQFDRAYVGHMPELFAAYDGLPPRVLDPGPEPTTPEIIEAGRRLVGNRGFGCVGCHDIAGRQGEGTRGPDLAYVRRRIRYPWFLRWMRDAQRISPGSRMPTVLPDPVSPIRNVLGGDPHRQIAAIWAYLSLEEKLPLPEGVLPPQGLVLTVKDRPVLLRTFMPDASTRSIAVGLPGGVSYVFDAGRGRFAYAWTGDFLDVRPVWTNRGGDPAIPLGPRFWQAPPLFPWMLTPLDELPDWQHAAKSPALVDPLPPTSLPPSPRRIWFRGYEIDKKGLPTFTVEFQAGKQRVVLRQQITGSNNGAGPAVFVDVRVPHAPDATLWYLAGLPDGQPLAFDAQGRLVETARQGGEKPAVKGYAWTEGDRNLAVVLAGGGRITTYRSGNKWPVVVRLTPQAGGEIRCRIGFWSPYALEPSILSYAVRKTAGNDGADPARGTGHR